MKNWIIMAFMFATFTACDRNAGGPEAVEEAAASPGGPCEVVYAAFRRPAAQLPDRAQFLAACERLPATAVVCLSAGYAMAHETECATAKATMDPGVIATMFTRR